MALLSKDQILGAPDLKTEDVSVPEWGGEVRVRAAMAIEMDDYEESLTTIKETPDGKRKIEGNFINAKARLVVKCLVDADGKRMFSDDFAAQLGTKNAAVINRLFQKIQFLSGRTAKVVEGMEKNSETGQNDGSPSSSPGILA
jgi:hypothetical protein